MKAITIKQPWASLIVESDEMNIGFGIKPIENRTWPCPKKYIGKRVLIHAGCRFDYKYTSRFTSEHYYSLSHAMREQLKSENFQLGAIIGSVEIVDCVINHESVWAEKTHSWNWLKGDFIPKDKRNVVYNWVLANPIKFDKPIPAKGKLSFWEFEM
jgi:hypothetical protein